MIHKYLYLAVILCLAAFGQSTSSPTFEAGDIHPSPKGFGTTAIGPIFQNGRYEIRHATMLHLITLAYLSTTLTISDQVTGGPNWLDFDRFDIVAKAPPDASVDDERPRLQALLEERFKLVVHKGTALRPEYALVLGDRKLQLKKSGGSAEPGCRTVQTDSVTRQIICENVTMQVLVSQLTVPSRGYLGLIPIVDATELTGAWDANFSVTQPAAYLATGEGDSIFDTIKKLGLKLERREAPAPALIVDSVLETPTPNPQGTAEALGALNLNAEFEVAAIRPIADSDTTKRGNIGSNIRGRQSMSRGTLRYLITWAWDANFDAIVSGPKFLDTDRYEVNVEEPSGVPVPVKTIRPELKKLLTDRFGIVAHEEMRPVDSYVLTAAKGGVKMTRGNDAERGSCKSTPEKLVPKSGFTTAQTCINTTMLQLAEFLAGVMPSYNGSHPIFNETELAGTWDFVLLWTNQNAQQSDKDGVLTPAGGRTIFEALEKLGLKLTLQKHAAPVLVIDHVEQRPAEN